MRIVDAQIHIWTQGLPSNQAHWQITSFTAAEAIKLMDEAGVEAAVIHPPGWDPTSQAVAEAAIKDYPGRFAALGSPSLNDSSSRELIRTWRDRPGVLGVRYLFLSDERRAMLNSGAVDWLWEACEEFGVPAAVLATDELATFGKIAERHPGLKLTIDHLGGRGGNTTLKDHAAMTHMPELLKLAALPNVAVKATGAPGYSAEPYPFPIMLGYIRQIMDAFGPERVFWGTDISKMPCSWTECIDMFGEHMPWLDDDARRLVMGDAFCKWWGWDRAAA